MSLETARKYLLALKSKNNGKAINEYGKALEKNLERDPESESNLARLKLYKEIFATEEKEEKTKK